MPTMTMFEFLSWLIYSGGALVFVSAVLERIPSFKLKTKDAKEVIVLVIDTVLVLAVYAVLNYVPADVLTSLDPWFKILAGVWLPYAAQQVFHEETKEPAVPAA